MEWNFSNVIEFYDTLSSDRNIKEAYKAGVLKMLKANTNYNLQWDLFREALVKTTRDVIPKKEKKSKNKWITLTSMN